MPYANQNFHDGLELIYSSQFPKTTEQCTKKYRNDILVGIGGNIGDMVSRFDELYHFWVKSKYLCIVESSPILKNPPFGYKMQDDFYNAVVHIRSDLSPEQFLKYMLRIEKIFGRTRSFDNAPRTLDIDIIFYNMMSMNTDSLTLPHPKYEERESVTIPLEKMKGISWLKRLL